MQTRSLTRAAQREDLTQSQVSRRLSGLEGSVGAKLVHRTSRGLRVTDIGAAFYEHCLRMLKEMEEAKDLVQRDREEPCGKLRVAGPMSFGIHHLAGAVSDYQKRYPRVCVELELKDGHVDLVGQGFDLAVQIGLPSASDVVARKLAPCRMVVCASAQYLSRCGVPRTLPELSQHTCLLYNNNGTREPWRFRVDGAWRSPPELKWSFSANSVDALLASAKSGQGVAVLPTFVAYQALAHGELVLLLRDYELQERTICAVYPRNRYLTRRVRAFIDSLVERFDGEPYWDTSWSSEGHAQRA